MNSMPETQNSKENLQLQPSSDSDESIEIILKGHHCREKDRPHFDIEKRIVKYLRTLGLRMKTDPLQRYDNYVS